MPVTKPVGRPRRYTDRQERSMVNFYIKVRKENKKAPTIDHWKHKLKNRRSLLPLPKSKNTWTGILKRWLPGGKWYKKIRGAVGNDQVETRRWKETKKLQRRGKKEWKTDFLFLDFKYYKPRLSPEQKAYSRMLGGEKVFCTSEERQEPWARAGHMSRNKPAGPGNAFQMGVVIGCGRVIVAAKLPNPYNRFHVRDFLLNDVEPALVEQGFGKETVLRCDRDSCLTSRVGKAALNSLSCSFEFAQASMQDTSPLDFSFWSKVKRDMLEEEASGPFWKAIQKESEHNWTARLFRTIRTVPREFIDKTIASVYNRMKNIRLAKGKHPKE
mmetsp:Transcript_52768/g.103181  ORF Transcript_52768/g.103181 Transcript_52768/m.103181 type:complete len:327 (+) Transcript_52768:221-1201(+)